jgi:hypothetical protein
MRSLWLAAVVGLVACGCGSSPTTPEATTTTSSPTPEPLVDSLTISAVSPSSGVVVVPGQYVYYDPGGVVLPRHSGLISVNLSIESAHDVPWAKLNVYLLTGGGTSDYCGQNSPDSPTWGSVPAGWTTTYTVTGFRVYQLPCQVTGVRAQFHTRNNGLLTPPTASETIAEATFPVSFVIRR